MLIIHIISTEDTKDFASIYKGCEDKINTSILINPTKFLLKQAIMREKERIIFIGHGTEDGLLNKQLDGFLIDSDMVQFLRNKEIVGIWCNASTFASKYDLKGFFTSMFISNCHELLDCGFVLFENCGEEIKHQNNLFSQRLNDLMLSKTPLTEWSKKLKSFIKDDDHKFVKFNYEAIYSSQIDD